MLALLVLTVLAASAGADMLDVGNGLYRNWSGILYIQQYPANWSNATGEWVPDGFTLDRSCLGHALPSLMLGVEDSRRYCTARFALRNPFGFNITLPNTTSYYLSHYYLPNRTVALNESVNITMGNALPLASAIYHLENGVWVPLSFPLTLTPGYNWFLLVNTKHHRGDTIEWGVRAKFSTYEFDVDPFFTGAESQSARARVTLGTSFRSDLGWNGTAHYIDRVEDYSTGLLSNANWVNTSGTQRVVSLDDENGNPTQAIMAGSQRETNQFRMATGYTGLPVSLVAKFFMNASFAAGDDRAHLIAWSDSYTASPDVYISNLAVFLQNSSGTEVGGGVSAVSGSWAWLRLDQYENRINGFYSPDGLNWTLIGSLGEGKRCPTACRVGIQLGSNQSVDDISIHRLADNASYRSGILFAASFDTGNDTIGANEMGTSDLTLANATIELNGIRGASANFTKTGVGRTNMQRLNTNVTGMTVCAWARPRSAGDGTQNIIVDRRSATALFWTLQVNESGGYVFITNNDAGTAFFVGATPAGNGVAAHVCGVWNSTHYALWVNGTLSASTAGTSLRYDDTGSLALGMRNQNGDRGFNGTLDEVVIWSRAVQGQELLDFYNDGGRVTERVNLSRQDSLAASYVYSDAGGTGELNTTLDWFRDGTELENYTTVIAVSNITASPASLDNLSSRNSTMHARILSCDTGAECDYAWTQALFIVGVRPNVTLTAPADSGFSFGNSSPPEWNYTVSDGDGDVLIANLTLNGTVVNASTGLPGSGAGSIVFDDWDGTDLSGDCLACPWNVSAWDSSPNVAVGRVSATRSVHLDYIPYNTSVNGFGNQTITDTSSFMLFTHHNYSFAANRGVVSHGACNATFRSVEYIMSYDSVNSRWNTSAIGPLAFGDADNAVYSCVNTNTSAVSETELVNVTDATPPGISFQGQTPANASFRNITTFTVNITIVDNSTPARGNLSVSNGTGSLPLESINGTDGENTAIVTEFASVARIALNVTLADRRGNVNTSVERVFYIDATAPVLDNFSWPSRVTSPANITIDVNATDNMEGNGSIVGVLVEVLPPTGGAVNYTANAEVSEGFTHRAAFPSSQVGTYRLQAVYVNDSVSDGGGNRAWNNSLSLEIESVNPSGSSSPGAGAGVVPVTVSAASVSTVPGRVDGLCIIYPWMRSGRTCTAFIGKAEGVNDSLTGCNTLGYVSCMVVNDTVQVGVTPVPDGRFAMIIRDTMTVETARAHVTVPVSWRVINLRWALPLGPLARLVPGELAVPLLFAHGSDDRVAGLVLAWPVLVFGLVLVVRRLGRRR